MTTIPDSADSLWAARLTGAPITIPDGLGGMVEHSGWVISDDDPVPEQRGGWGYIVPAARCPRCHLGGKVVALHVAGVRVVGGVYSVIWLMDCHVCQLTVEYPATAHRDQQ